MLATWMSFASGGRKLRGGVLSMLETHIVRGGHFLTCFTSHFFYYFVSVHSWIQPSLIWFWSMRITLSLDALVTAHVLVVVIVSRIGLVLPLEGPSSNLSRDTWMVHAFSIVVHVPLGQVVRCKGL
jgi:hypothetical protein